MAKDFYRCNNCSKVSEVDNLATQKGAKVPIGDTYTYLPDEDRCPSCGAASDFTPVYQCRECKEYFEASEYYRGYCKPCLEKHMDWDTAESFGIDHLVSVEINPLLTQAFDESEIEEILYRELKASKDKDKTAREVCGNDLSEFGEWLSEREEV